jgi:diacylglycerol O-acyltransferase / wax synthase
MKRLSALDAAFLYLETPETPMNIGSLTLFAPTAASPDAIFQSFRDHTVARLDLLPSYRRRVQMTPLSIDHPVWVDEDELDLNYHIRRRALPHPGRMEQLRSLIAELHMIPLDRARPLWQYYLIEGLEDGGFAVYIKIHHANMDGVSGLATLPVVYDFSPVPMLAPSPAHRQPIPAKPGFGQLVRGALHDFLGQDLRLAKAAPRFAGAVAKVGRRAVGTLKLLPDAVGLAPRTPFNVSISKERSYGTASVSLTDVKYIAKSRQATVNDVVMAISAGALCRYLSARKALPRKPLIAAVPLSLREPGHTELNNQVAVMLCGLATDVEDPLERLAAITASSRDSRGRFVDVKAIWPTEMSLPGVPIVITGLARLAARTRLFDFVPTVMNLWISNIPGPRQPMYCAGAPALHYFPVSVPYHGCALNITVQSYLDYVEFGLTACRTVVPDVQLIADHVTEELAVLKRATDAVSNAGAIDVIEIAATSPANGAPHRRQKRARRKDAPFHERIAIDALAARPEKRAARRPAKTATADHAEAPLTKSEHH